MILEAQGEHQRAIDCVESALVEFRNREIVLRVADAERHLARLKRLQGDLSDTKTLLKSAHAADRQAGARPAVVRDLTELSFLSSTEQDLDSAREHAQEALAILRETRTRLDEPAALAALSTAHRAAGRDDLAKPLDERWRRLVDGMQAPGLKAWIERSIASVSEQAQGST